MAYMSQEQKALINASLKKTMPKDWKWSLSVSNHSTIVLTISAAPVDLCQEWVDNINIQAQRRGDNPRTRPDYIQVNQYYLETQFNESLEILEAANQCLHEGHYDNSDAQTDYFDTAWYVDINIGRWNKPFVYNAPMKIAA